MTPLQLSLFHCVWSNDWRSTIWFQYMPTCVQHCCVFVHALEWRLGSNIRVGADFWEQIIEEPHFTAHPYPHLHFPQTTPPTQSHRCPTRGNEGGSGISGQFPQTEHKEAYQGYICVCTCVSKEQSQSYKSTIFLLGYALKMVTSCAPNPLYQLNEQPSLDINYEYTSSRYQ